MTVLRLGMNDSKLELNEKHKPLFNAPPVAPLLPGAFILSHTTPSANILLSEHLDNAYEASEAAFQNDPMYLYLAAVRACPIYRAIVPFNANAPLRGGKNPH